MTPVARAKPGASRCRAAVYEARRDVALSGVKGRAFSREARGVVSLRAWCRAAVYEARRDGVAVWLAVRFRPIS